MNEHERNEIERDERWLEQFETPLPDAVTMERVRTALRVEVGADVSPRGSAKVVELAKAAVRREVRSSPATAPTPLALRLYGPIGVLAAAVALAFAVLWGDGGVNDIRDPELAAFVEVMSRPVDPTVATLIELDDAILRLTFREADAGAGDWEDFGFDDDAGMDTDDSGSS